MERKASDIILDLESKIINLIKSIETIDFNIKLLSNKLKVISDKIDNLETKGKKNVSGIVAKSTDSPPLKEYFERVNEIKEERKTLDLTIDQAPVGQRRTDRVLKPSKPEFSGPVQVLSGNTSKFVSPEATNNQEEFNPQYNKVKNKSQQVPVEQQKEIVNDGNLIKVSQRVVNENGKAEFFADVSIQELPSLNKVKSTRTTGTGLWSVMIPKGNYRVSIKTKQSINNEFRKNSFDINLDGRLTEVDLDKLII